MGVSNGTEQTGAIRDAITKLAVLGDVDGLRAAAERLPATMESAYDRHRARALALALEGKPDSAVAELNAGSAAQLQDTSTLAADLAEIRLLSGDPEAAVAALALGLEDPARPRRRVAAAVSSAGAAVGALGGRLGTHRPFGDRFRVVAGAASLAAAVGALLLLPRSLDERESAQIATQLARPDQPRPSVVRVPTPPAQARGDSRSRAREAQIGAASQSAFGGLGAADGLPAASSFGSLAPTRSGPGAPSPTQPTRPAQPTTPPQVPPPTAPPAPPAPAPTPAPTPPPVAAQPTQPTRSQPAQTAARQPAESTSERGAPEGRTVEKKGKKAKKKDKQDKQQPAQQSSSNASVTSTQVPPGPPSHAAEQHGGPPGQEKKDDEARGGGDDKDKGEKEKGPKK